MIIDENDHFYYFVMARPTAIKQKAEVGEGLCHCCGYKQKLRLGSHCNSRKLWLGTVTEVRARISWESLDAEARYPDCCLIDILPEIKIWLRRLYIRLEVDKKDRIWGS